MTVHGITSGSLVAAVTGTTRPTPGLLRSMATTRGRIATATTGAAQLSHTPEAASPPAMQPVHHTKGLLDPGGDTPKYSTAHPCPSAEGDALWGQVVSFEGLFRAWKRARAGKRHQAAVAAFSANLEHELIQLQNELTWETWQPGEYEHFIVSEPKRRVIYAPAIRDRVVHHSLHAALTSIYEQSFHPRSYACRVGKGTHAGAATAQRLIRRTVRKHGCAYALKADISKYFDSINHGVLKALLRRRINSPAILRVLDLIIDTSPAADGVGIPLGNLTSQLFANIYLHELDHWAANIANIGGYVRYMDDFVVIHHDRQILADILIRTRAFLREHLRLELNPKTDIFSVSACNGRAVDFLGYRIYATHRRLRRRSVRKGYAYARAYALAKDTHTLDRLTSWYAHACHASPAGMMREVFKLLTQPPPIFEI